jgi:hypothetical protein
MVLEWTPEVNRPCQISSKSVQQLSIESSGQTDGQENMVSPICVHFVHIIQRTHTDRPT